MRLLLWLSRLAAGGKDCHISGRKLLLGPHIPIAMPEIRLAKDPKRIPHAAILEAYEVQGANQKTPLAFCLSSTTF